MIAYTEFLVKPAEDAFISVPLDEIGKLKDIYDPYEYPHWDVFCQLQLGAPMPDMNAHFHNAQIISRIPDEEIGEISDEEILQRGFKVGFSQSYQVQVQNNVPTKTIATLWVAAVFGAISTIFFVLR